MLKQLAHEFRAALMVLLLSTALAGIIYAAAITGIAQILFPLKANGSLVERNGRVVGSELIAQSFASARYFWPRPSAAGYNAAASSGSNLALSNPAFIDAVKTRIADYRTSDSLNLAPVPADLALASASGLDPEISVEAALWQVPRVARERGLAESAVRDLVEKNTARRTFGVLGEERVNVLRLNLALDAQSPGL